MRIIRSRFKKGWVLIQFSPDDGWVKGYVKKLCYEAGQEAYDMVWEDGTEEPVFVTSIHRIRWAGGKKCRVINLDQRRKRLLRIV